MKKYKFILKPALFIFNLLFATWLVFEIESITPSDFGRYKYLFDDPPLLKKRVHRKEHLLKLCTDFKNGSLDSAALNQKIDIYLTSSGEFAVKEKN